MDDVTLDIRKVKIWADRTETKQIDVWKADNINNCGSPVCGLGVTTYEAIENYFLANKQHNVRLKLMVENEQS